MKKKLEPDHFAELPEDELVFNRDEISEIKDEEEQPQDKEEENSNTAEDEYEEKFAGGGKYLELIRSEEQSEIVFELPSSGEESGAAFELPDEITADDSEFTETEGAADTGNEIPDIDENAGNETDLILEKDETADNEDSEKIALNHNETPDGIQEEDEIIIESAEDIFEDKESSFRIVSKISGIEDTADERLETEEEKLTLSEEDLPELKEEKTGNESVSVEKDKQVTMNTESENEELYTEREAEGRIELSDEIQEEIKSFKENPEEQEEEEFEITEEISAESAEQVTNAEFMEFEKEIELKNNQLKNDFDIMIYLVKARPGEEEERNSIIKSIMEISEHLESKSRKMMLEIISNMYQTINLSFEKISDGKYDISESTLTLFKKGLDFIMGMIRGDNYYDYKDIFKSIENIRRKLIAEKEKREEFQKRLDEKQEIERRLNSKYPEDRQREKLSELRKMITDTENKFLMIEKISGEYRTYEALRSLSLCLINFKEIVKLSNELELKTLSKLSESGYTFLKFLQGYRINPESDEIRETNRYIIKCMKAIYMDKHPEDIEIFISYLNDPVKILGKSDFKNSQKEKPLL